MADQASMVEQVKAWQKRSEGHKNGWYHFVREKGQHNFDPKLYDESLLTEFLSMANSGQIDVNREHPDGARGKGGWGGDWGGMSSASQDFSVKLGNLPPEGRQTENQIKEFLNSQGITSMTDVFVPNGKVFGFVRFPNKKDADLCMQACQGLELGGQAVTVEFAKNEQGRASGKGGKGDMMSMMNMMMMMQGGWGKGWGKGKGGWSSPY